MKLKQLLKQIQSPGPAIVGIFIIGFLVILGSWFLRGFETSGPLSIDQSTQAATDRCEELEPTSTGPLSGVTADYNGETYTACYTQRTSTSYNATIYAEDGSKAGSGIEKATGVWADTALISEMAEPLILLFLVSGPTACLSYFYFRRETSSRSVALTWALKGVIIVLLGITAVLLFIPLMEFETFSLVSIFAVVTVSVGSVFAGRHLRATTDEFPREMTPPVPGISASRFVYTSDLPPPIPPNRPSEAHVQPPMGSAPHPNPSVPSPPSKPERPNKTSLPSNAAPSSVRQDSQAIEPAQPPSQQASEDPVSPAETPGTLPSPSTKEVTSHDTARKYGPGDIINGRFEVESILGTGGFSTVYLVSDPVEDNQFALKVFDQASGYDAVRRELSALRKVRHPNIVEVIWAGRTNSDEWFLLTEFVEGTLLADHLRGDNRLDDAVILDIGYRLLDALKSIHPDTERLELLERKKREGDLTMDEYEELQESAENSLVHRDIKPQNVILGPRGPKLLDFNIASRVGDSVMTISGTPPYQPPGADLTRWDVATDLFAIGVTLYQLFCSQHPYEGARPMSGLDPRDPRKFRPDLSDEVALFLLKSCAADRDERFPTAAIMQRAVGELRN